MTISKKFDVQVLLDKLTNDLADSIDNEILYETLGWTIVDVPYQHAFLYGSKKVMQQWVDANAGEHFYWDGKFAFKEGRDATAFLLRWL